MITRLKGVLAIGVLLALPVSLFAQEAVLTGTITDATGGVLPGVTVTAVHEATGNRFLAVTDERGISAALHPRPGGDRGMAEIFNLFNSPNWTIETTESNRPFGQAMPAEFRRAQLGFRLTF